MRIPLVNLRARHTDKQRLVTRLLAALALATLVAVPASGAPAQATGAPPGAWAAPPPSPVPIRLNGSTDPAVLHGHATRLGAYNPQQMLRLVFALYPRNVAQEQQYLHDMQTKGSPLYHHRMSKDEWMARFAPAAADEQAVVDWAQSQGLTVTQRWANRLTVNVTAPVATIQRAFNIHLNSYRLDSTTFFAADQGPQLPARLSSVVGVVMGLDGRQVFRPAGLDGPPVKGLNTRPDAVFSAGPVVGAANTIKLIGHPLAAVSPLRASGPMPHLTGAASGASGVQPSISNGAYDPTDLYSPQAYDYQELNTLSRCCNPLNNPGGSPAETSIAIVGFDAVADSDVQGFVTQYPYLAKNVTYIPVNGTPQYGTANAEETTLDTEYALAMANDLQPSDPNDTAHIYVYEGADASPGGIITELQAIIAAGTANIVSDSFFTTEAILGSDNAHAIDGTLTGLIMDGLSVVAAAGDNGPYGSNDPGNPQSCVSNTPIADFPASDPNVVSVGGTALHLNADGSYNSETAWTGPSNSCGFNQGGGGAGCSSFFAAQSYQAAEVAEAPCFGKRGYPDLSLNASASTLQNFYFNGSVQQNAGTSVATPEVAAFLAQDNSYLQSLGPICYGFNCSLLGNPDVPLYYASAGAPHYPYYDITSGCDGNSAGPGYCATIGYDTATGWGSANMFQLAWALNWETLADTGAPIVSFAGSSAQPGTWYGHIPLAVQVTITDTGGQGTASGVAGYSATWDADPGDPFNEAHPGTGNSFYNGPQYPRQSSGAVYLNASYPQGCHTLYVRAWDNMGLGSGAQPYGPICYDTTPPVVNSITFTPPSPSTAASVQINVSATDPGASSSSGSGVAHIDYYVNTASDGSASGTFNYIGTSSGASGNVTWTTAGYAQGTHLVEVKVYDNAGNCDCGSPSTDNTAKYTLSASCAPANATSSAYAQAILASQPLGYWRLDETCIGGVADSSGHGLTGTTQGGVTPNQPGAPLGDGDAAMSFDGASGYVSLGDPTALQPSQVSVEAWIKASTITSTNQVIVRKRLYGYGLYLNASKGQPVFDINDVNAVPYTAMSATSLADGKWHYLVGTYNGSQVCLYVDGALAGSCQPAAAIYYQPDLVAIGRDGGSSSSYFAGSIDDVAIYGSALSASQVQAHYAAASSASATATASAQATNSPTTTPVSPTSTPTNTPVPPTSTPTNTPVPPTATSTNTPVPPTSTPTNTPVPAASLAVSPLTVTVGQTLTLTGTAFGPGEPVALYWDSTASTALTTTSSTASGSFTLSLKAPAAVVGPHTLIAVGQSSQRQATATLSIQPKLTLMPTSGLPGARIKASGSGFGATETVTLHWKSATGTRLGSATSSSVGSVGTLTITIPATAPPGTYKVYAVGTTSKAQATASFKVT